MPRLEEISAYLWQDSPGPDEITQTFFRSWDELYGMSREEIASWQLESARERFRTLRPQIVALNDLAEAAGVDRIESPESLVPLLFQHTQYKSYPMSLLEKRRFDILTDWLNDLTTVDLSGVDASGCEGIDEWLELLENEADLWVFHTTGTTGKLSFLPRSRLDRAMFALGYIKIFEGYGDNPGIDVGFDGQRFPHIYPSMRHGRHSGQRNLDFFAEYVTPAPEHIYTANNGTLSADLVSLSGRIRVAQAKGELDKMQLDNAQKIALKRYLDELERRPQELDAFMQRIMEELKGQRVMIGTQATMMTQAAKEGLGRGIKNVFAEGSIGNIGGGNKDTVLPENWKQMVEEFSGIKTWVTQYGMTEMLGSGNMCENGYYHLLPYHIPFAVEPESGKALPREGVQTGRFAFLDLLASSYWATFVTGDKVTIDFDNDCGCGRTGVFVHDPIVRYSETVTGDDKVTCSATVDNTDAALEQLLSI